MGVLTFQGAGFGRHRFIGAPTALLLVAVALGLFAIEQSAGAQSPVPEYRVKATFLFQFTQFVDWPLETFPTPEAPLVIAVFGEDPFGSFLDETVRDEKANTHPLVVQRYQRLEDIKNCHVLFVS